jgi:hypothetical protein
LIKGRLSFKVRYRRQQQQQRAREPFHRNLRTAWVQA